MNVRVVKGKVDTVRTSSSERSDKICHFIRMSRNKNMGHMQHKMNIQHRGTQGTHETSTLWGTCKISGMCSIHDTGHTNEVGHNQHKGYV